ncbi:hypothetical protein HNY73_019132 [Argiope bruennichi]|uniref:Uncharacterized protein n=1 Tax=Argiope bruennichi TaxID=94029 RepID=A0A8T0EGB4_ARGBR|nr:hypothetical protein HNY73_019132 [Argiope bruennichi]
MVCDMEVRKVAKDVLLFMCFKNEIINEKPSPDLRFIPEVTAELLNNLTIAVWMEVSRAEMVWEVFFRNHFKRMTSTTYRFVNYVAYAFYVLIRNSDAYDSFLDTLSIASYFALLCWEKGSKVYINMCVDLFCEFFEKEIRAKFEDKGGWQNLNEYLLKHFSLTRYKILVRENVSPFEYFQSLKKEIGLNKDLVYQVNDVFLSNVTQRQVETDKKAINFTKSVEGKMKKLCERTFDEILEEFAKTDCQLEDLYRQQVETASGDMASIEEQSLLQRIQEDASENIPTKNKSVEKELERETVTPSDPLKTENSRTVDIQGAAASVELNPKLRKSERAKELLDDMSTDISKLRGLIQSLCEDEWGVSPDTYAFL